MRRHDKAPIPKSLRGSSGGGQSAIFAKPSFQGGILPKSRRRNIPDVSFAGSAFSPGFFLRTGTPPTIACCFGATSLGAPVWAGISALAAQNAGVARIGNINASIYALGPSGNTSSSGFHDITIGNNGFKGGSRLSGEAGLRSRDGMGHA